MSVFKKISMWMSDTGRVFRNEMKTFLHDPGVLLFFFALPLLYPVVYTLIYNPEVVTKMPVAVVDESRSAESRNFVQKASAAPAIAVYAYCNDLQEARELMYENKVFGIMQIPSDYGKNIGRNDPAHIEFYADMSLLLRYRTFAAALTDLQLELINETTGERISAAGLNSLAQSMSLIQSDSNFLGDTEQGFASFIIPGIIILILQQSMLLGICMLGGTAAERRRRNKGYDPMQVHGVGVTATVWGKALAYMVIYIPQVIYVLRFIPEMFNLPHYGSPTDYFLFIAPMMLATAFLGQTLNAVMRDRESPFIIIVFTSVWFLFLSGLTWPRYAMSPIWKVLGDTVPAIWGVEGFIRINSNAASLSEVGTDFAALWILSLVYLITACIVTKATMPFVCKQKWQESKD